MRIPKFREAGAAQAGGYDLALAFVLVAITVLVWHNVPALADVAYEVISTTTISALSIVLVSQFTRPVELES